MEGITVEEYRRLYPPGWDNRVDANGRKLFSVECLQGCGLVYSLRIMEDDFYDWKGGMLIQEAFPYLNDDERELLISRTCPNCWDEMFETAIGEDPE